MGKQIEKLLPQNIEAEMGVLGSIIIDPEAIDQVIGYLRPEDFYRDAHRLIYETVMNLKQQGNEADYITVCDILERRDKLELVGGATYITSLINQVPTSGNIEYYGRIVQRTGVLRRLVAATGQIAALVYEDMEVEQVLEQAERTIFEISQNFLLSTSTDIGMAPLMSLYMEILERRHEMRGEVVGVPTGYVDLDRLLGGLQRSDLDILAARTSIGKCLTAHTLIDDPRTGERLTIEEYVRRQLPLVYRISEEGHIRQTFVTDWIDSGVQPCYRVRTCLGRTVETTGHHPFLTINGWIPLHDLTVGSHIAVPTSIPTFGSDESWPLGMVRLLAYFIAEGGLTDHSPEFTQTDSFIVEDFKQIIATHFPTCAIRQEKITYIVAQPRNATTMRRGAILPKNPLTVWLRDLGLMGKLAKDKRFPACVWTWSRRFLAEFLRVLMSCDGSIYPSHGVPRIEFTVASPQLAADVQHALLRFGIIAKYYKTSQGAWRVEITARDDVQRYQENIGWIGEKASRFAEFAYSPTVHPRNNGHAPKEVWSIIRTAARLKGLSLISLARQSGELIRQGRRAGYNAQTGRAVPRRRLAAYAEVLDHSQLRFSASPDIYWDEIESIEYIGKHQVYDLTVPDGSNFIAQDIFVHNTALAINIAYNAAIKHKRNVGIFSLEMSREQLAQRFVALDAGIEQQKLRTGRFDDDTWEPLINAVGKLAELGERGIRIDDTAGISLLQVRSRARRWVAEYGIELIIIDYLQLVTTGDNRKYENRQQEVSAISRGLKALARELNVPVLALAQLSRQLESRQSKVPQLSDLRESGCLTGDIPIYLPDEGIYRQIKDLVGQSGFRVLALNTETWKLEPHTVTNAFSTGRKQTYKITTRLGCTIRATANHKFLTIHGWKRLDELQSGTHLALPRNLPGPSNQSMTNAELALLGHLIGDGCTLERSAIEYITGDYGLAEGVMHLATEVFGDRVRPQGNAYCGTGLYKQNMSRERAARLAKIVLSEPLMALAQSDVYWDSILSISIDEETEVYDLTVEGLHNFVASDIIVHNSIENDADVVMFIYRDEVYNPETERKGQADIIVAKHRNGPTGEVVLAFDQARSRFRDLDIAITPDGEIAFAEEDSELDDNITR